jgi:class 3 adenylate cyclase
VDGNFRVYDFAASRQRIYDILGQPAGQFEDVNELPDRDRLTFTNGFYAQFCTAVFVDLRDSSKLPVRYKRPQLARIYRAFISEMVAVLNGAPKVREVNIVGDCVWAVYSSPLKPDNDRLLSAIAQANSLMAVLNHKLNKRGFDTPLRAGIGAADGRALMIKAGYSGSGISEVVYMGEVVNSAAKLANQAASTAFASPMLINDSYYESLDDENKGFFSRDWSRGCYSGDVINIEMNDWVKAQ